MTGQRLASGEVLLCKRFESGTGKETERGQGPQEDMNAPRHFDMEYGGTVKRNAYFKQLMSDESDRVSPVPKSSAQ